MGSVGGIAVDAPSGSEVCWPFAPEGGHGTAIMGLNGLIGDAQRWDSPLGAAAAIDSDGDAGPISRSTTGVASGGDIGGPDV